MRIAIPVYGEYVSNVFDFAHRLLLVLKQAYSVYFSTGMSTDFFGTAITRQPRAA